MPDILIRGMEMPSKGYKTVILHSNGSVYEPTSNELILNKIADATGLPPHGDLIDRDRLKHKFCTHCDGYEYDTNSCVDGDQDCMDARLIMIAPVVVPAERSEP